MKKNTKKLCRLTNNCIYVINIVLLCLLCQQNILGQEYEIFTSPSYTRAQTRPFKDSIVLKGDEEHGETCVSPMIRRTIHLSNVS